MYNRNDPRFRRTLNQISQNLESANETAQVGLFSFSEHYVKPCFASISKAIEPCIDTCSPRTDTRRRQRAKSRGRPELNFDFYDDWEEDENDALLSLGNDEFDRLLGDSGAQGSDGQPGQRGGMNYGSHEEGAFPRPRRRSEVSLYDGTDPTIIPNQSRFGFLSKLPFNLGAGKGLRYKPSAADLQERPWVKGGGLGQGVVEEERDEEGGGRWDKNGSRRQRSTTVGSGHTTDSYSSRGDIFPSDDEVDAVPLDDEFAVALERRYTEDASAGKTKGSPRPRGKRSSTRTLSSRDSLKSSSIHRQKSASSIAQYKDSESPMSQIPTMSDLKIEEDRVRAEDEEEIERKRIAAQKLARDRGLSLDDEVLTGQRISPAVATAVGSTPANGFPFPILDALSDDISGDEKEERSTQHDNREFRRSIDAQSDFSKTERHAKPDS